MKRSANFTEWQTSKLLYSSSTWQKHLYRTEQNVSNGTEHKNECLMTRHRSESKQKMNIEWVCCV
ncbi:CLUMA_CG014823, isoform A [Clunio marinus]|uniref:CLUMA_CG014823, isoform A n=1 Tax=Clunio marinus TaxID=568069 RepID=A0A1J1IR98_9DIPT|nr:CLUMA_CG014823, isoform A [Clunio marinus]